MGTQGKEIGVGENTRCDQGEGRLQMPQQESGGGVGAGPVGEAGTQVTFDTGSPQWGWPSRIVSEEVYRYLQRGVANQAQTKREAETWRLQEAPCFSEETRRRLLSRVLERVR